ncbi:hypothetical protein RIB2604_02007140 [Aspergillus luchuensis]|uniref:non-specific serine/threonine protein kinase n=1 Tax=Aspergillus kawachii TaxID=1069201 RepID=A0A146FJT9_ASPKA|nr:hypothetical protein RIB2604_02007140 [Aspergillus luchuensis]
MATPWRSLRISVNKVFKSSPCRSSNVPRQTLPAAEVVEEECTPHYEPNHFYPVRLYEILNNRYQITAKLGWGASSTVWLARDLNQRRWCPARYVAVKIKANNYSTNKDAERELRITENITRSVSGEVKEPLPQKQLEDRTIYLSRNHFGVEANSLGRPVITDFGLAVEGSQTHYHLIQPDSFRAQRLFLEQVGSTVPIYGTWVLWYGLLLASQIL